MEDILMITVALEGAIALYGWARARLSA